MHSAADDVLAHHPAGQFYGRDHSFFPPVGGYLADGLIAGQPAIAIATRAHSVAIVDHLGTRLIDCEKAIRNGDLVILDAEATLDLFMVGGTPDADLFAKNVGRLIDQAINGRQRTVLRAYGEMVDVLWKQGRSEAAIRLEILWNKLALTYNFALLCGYAMGSFYRQTKQLEEVISQHTHVIAHDTSVVPFPPKGIRPA